MGPRENQVNMPNTGFLLSEFLAARSSMRQGGGLYPVLGFSSITLFLIKHQKLLADTARPRTTGRSIRVKTSDCCGLRIWHSGIGSLQ